MSPQARWWHSTDGQKVACELCPIGCTLAEGDDGPCSSRGNRQGAMVPLQYGQLVSAAMDPIEKKPLYHFYPGTEILSVAGPGCNLHCMFCQNWTISQDHTSATQQAAPAEIVDAALHAGSVGIAYTYSEPLVWYEFVLDTARLARQAGLVNVLVTNGFLNPEPLAELLPWIDAANVDLKSMDDVFYRTICKARLAPVLAAIRQIFDAGVHLEITNLLIPEHNDSDEQINRLVDFVAGLDRSIALHFSAYRPAWQMKAPPTPQQTLLRARALALEKMDWVYLGNVSVSEGCDTLCPACGETAVARTGRQTRVFLKNGDHCCGCGRRLDIKTGPSS